MNREEARRRATELVNKMTVEQMASQLRYDAPSIDELGIPEYNWWGEGLHGLARAGTATSFPQAIALGASFDPDLLQEIGDAISTEARAKYNEYSSHEDRDIYKGITLWSPNINLFRDPRWGRGHETYGEDPYLITQLAKQFIEGLQGRGEYLKVAACAKHFAVHSGPEALRHVFDARVSLKEMYETYLPQFEACIKEANVESIMGAYNRTNGEPCCAHSYLMDKVLFEDWKFEGHFVSDCWAVLDFHKHHKVTEDVKHSAALALERGCDLNCGCAYVAIMDAYRDGLIPIEHIRRSAIKLFTTRYLLGMFDSNEFDSIPYEKVECAEHIKLAQRATEEGTVLLKNDGILPLDKNKYKKIGVIGPCANSRGSLIGNYYGTSSSYITILDGLNRIAEDEDVRILYSEGCDLSLSKPDNLSREYHRISEAKIVAEHSDVVVLCIGLDEFLEGEEGDQGNQYYSGDKDDLSFPKPQQLLIKTIIKTGVPFVTVVTAGSALDLSLLDIKSNAILQAWYPGARGGKTIAEILFGKVNPSGKLPITIYKSLEGMPEFTDYSMKDRTYRFMENEALYPFGFGLSYGDIDLIEAAVEGEAFFPKDESDKFTIKAKIVNRGTQASDEVVQVYLKVVDDANEIPNPRLVAFKRVHLEASEEKEVDIEVSGKAFTTVNDDGVRGLFGSKAEAHVGFGQPNELTKRLLGKNNIALFF
ncbi:MAG: glycoside hydrolase family 3 C-terminal domain-containing protein [Clostridia bacterium]|nr:glycoside hydrolase family 3 C-terminal domain-containing protein [Clostridia bacterium]